MAHQVVTDRHRSAKTRRAKARRQAKREADTRRMRITKGDIVMVIAGDHQWVDQEKGVRRTGKVLMVIPEKQTLIVEKVNMVKRHVKPNQRQTQGGIHEKEAPIHVSNVKLVDPKSRAAGRIGVRILPDGKRERILRNTGEAVPRTGR